MVDIDLNALSTDFEAAIDRVEAGDRITMLIDGKARAMLIPYTAPKRSETASTILE